MHATIQKTIRTTLKAIPAIELAIVFGSIAANRENPESDIDLAVLTDEPLDASHKIKIIEALAQATGRAIDLIDLKTAGQPLLREIISNGKRITGSDTLYAQLITKTLFDQADFLPYRNRILEQRREAWIGK